MKIMNRPTDEKISQFSVWQELEKCWNVDSFNMSLCSMKTTLYLHCSTLNEFQIKQMALFLRTLLHEL